METYKFEKSQELFAKAAKIIPCGIYGHLSPAPLVPTTAYPFYAEKAKGSKFWDIDGNEFIDYMCAYGPMAIGYNNPVVDDAAKKQYDLGNCITAPAPVMVELAELLTDTVTMADWAFFAKNGNDVTSFATMIARAETGRKKIVVIKGGYHGTSPWTQGEDHHGIIPEDRENIIPITWNDVDEFERVINENPGQIAGFISQPYHHITFNDNVMPENNYWQKIEALCKKNGIVLIVDDVRCGFRLDMKGSNEYFGFKPDLVCFCKAIGNGYPISAIVGTDAMKDAASKVFYTGSYWYSAAPMAAAVACIKEMNRINAPQIMMDQGKKLLDGMVEIGKGYGYELKVTGLPSMPYLRITNDESLMLHQQWCAECTMRGAYFSSHHNWFVSTEHTDEDIQKTLEIADEGFKAVKKQFGDKF